MNRFYTTGGTMHWDAPSYLEREADADLLRGLLEAEFCYILTSRQMGKSSLMVHTAEKLKGQGIHVVVIDLTQLGQNINPEQWYDGMMTRIGQQLHLEEELEAYWLEHMRLSPVQRLFGMIREAALPRLQQSLVIFLDEIDTVRSLPFSTDEFFAAIRSCYNRRAEDEVYKQVTFCLLGVATPSDLIRDTRTTPFNIGRRIELDDFTAEEVKPLARGLQLKNLDTESLLERVMHWTHGHPYLTQRLCEYLTDHRKQLQQEAEAMGWRPWEPQGRGMVDRACRELFLTSSARQEDDNLIFVRERLLRGEVRREDLLSTYRKILRGIRKVPDERTNQVVTLLRLSGIVRAQDGVLRLRNEVYRRTFNRRWTDAHMPDAEKRRQREAYIRGAIRATLVILIFAAAGGFMTYRSNLATKRLLADSYAVRGNLLVEEGDLISALPWYTRALEMDGGSRERARRDRIQIALTLQQCPQLVHMWFLEGEAHSARFNPDGQLLAVAGSMGLVKVFEVTTGLARPGFTGMAGDVMSASFSPDGNYLAAADTNGTIRVWHTADGTVATTIQHTGMVYSVRFDRTGDFLLAAGSDRQAILWDWQQKSVAMRYANVHTDHVRHAAFSPDGSRIVTASQDGTAQIWDRWTGEPIGDPLVHGDWVYQATFSPDGARILTAGYDKTARIWDAATGAPGLTIEHDQAVRSAEFSPDGQIVATACWDLMTRFWSAETGKLAGPPVRHSSYPYDVSFNPEGYLLASSTAHGAVSIWNLIPTGWRPPVLKDVYSGDGLRYLSLVGEDARLWGAEARQPLGPSFAVSSNVFRAYLSRRGDRLVTVHKWVESPELTRYGAQLWDPIRGVSLGPMFPYARSYHLLALSHSGRMFVAYAGSEADIWDTASGQRKQHLERDEEVQFPTFDPSERRLLFAVGRQAEVIDLSGTGRPLLLPHPTQVSDVAFSNDGTKILTTCKDGSFTKYAAQLWEAETGEPLGEPMLHQDGVWSASFSPDDRRIVSSGEDNLAQTWSARTLRKLAAPLPHKDEVICASFSPDSDWIATGCRDKTARVWDARYGAPITPPLRHAYHVFDAVFVANGKGLVTEERRGIHRYWDLTPDPRPVAELKRWSQLLARYEVDTFGVAMPLELQELRDLWIQLTAERSGPDLPSSTSIREWHERQMADRRTEGNRGGERFHLQHLLEEDPDNAAWLRRMGELETAPSVPVP